MNRRTRRGHVNKEVVLPDLKAGRHGAIRTSTEAKIGSPEYKAAGEVIRTIDDLVEALTGDRDILHAKPHKIGGPG